MDNQKIIVEFKNVQKTYDGKNLVVKDFNLNIREGEFVTMLGPSGSGKTTCLMMLAGFETVTSGDILVHGKSITRVAPSKRNLGMVFQDYALFPHMTVFENLAFPLEIRKLSKKDIKNKVNEVLEKVHLQDFGGRKISQLSGGQKQRVAVARALVFEPEIILMDEPLGALDKNLREQMQYEIKNLHKSLGITFLYVTHDQIEALTMSNRIAIFENGIVQQYASPNDIYEKPSNAFVANFIGENNLFSGFLESSKNSRCNVKLSDGTIVEALSEKQYEIGSKVNLCMRPERVKISLKPIKSDNNVQANIIDSIYLGDHIRLQLSFAGANEFIIKIPNINENHIYSVGSAAYISWDVEDCRVL